MCLLVSIEFIKQSLGKSVFFVFFGLLSFLEIFNLFEWPFPLGLIVSLSLLVIEGLFLRFLNRDCIAGWRIPISTTRDALLDTFFNGWGAFPEIGAWSTTGNQTAFFINRGAIFLAFFVWRVPRITLNDVFLDWIRHGVSLPRERLVIAQGLKRLNVFFNAFRRLILWLH